MKRLTIALILLFTATLSQAGRPAGLLYRNYVGGEFPAITAIGGYPGISLGVNYERLLNPAGTLAAGLDFQHVWAGTLAHGELQNGELRANLKSDYFAPGFFYYPTGSNPAPTSA